MKNQTIHIYPYKKYIFEIIEDYRMDHFWLDIWITKQLGSHVKIKADFMFDATTASLTKAIDKIHENYTCYSVIYESFIKSYHEGFTKITDKMFKEAQKEFNQAIALKNGVQESQQDDNPFLEIEKLAEKTLDMYAETQGDKTSHNADIILIDVMGEVNFEEQRTAMNLMSLFQKTSDKGSFLDMFEFFTGIKFSQFLGRCVLEYNK